MSQPGEGHGFYPVRVNAVSCGAGDLGIWQQIRQASHQRRVVRAAASYQQFLSVRLSAL